MNNNDKPKYAELYPIEEERELIKKLFGPALFDNLKVSSFDFNAAFEQIHYVTNLIVNHNTIAQLELIIAFIVKHEAAILKLVTPECSLDPTLVELGKSFRILHSNIENSLSVAIESRNLLTQITGIEG